MQCPKCRQSKSKVLESRAADNTQAIRRRRECLNCGFRFSTYEQVEILDLTVVKRDGRRETYSFDKLYGGIQKSFEKRPTSDEDAKRFAEDIEREIQKRARSGEIRSSEIGDIVLKKLKRKDPVAYLRFASVYLQFENVKDFQQAISVLPSYKVVSKKKLN